MIGSFSLNAVESSVFKLVCKSVKRPLLPAAKVNRIEIQGASGAYDFSDNEYGLRTITMKIAYIGSDYFELRTRARQIAAWLSTQTWTRLIINDEPDKYYLAKVTDEIELESLWESGTADVAFDCQPFAYSITESSLPFTATDNRIYEFNNLGTRVIDFKSPYGSKFKITVVGSWTTISLGMNGSVLDYTEAGSSATLIIDNIEMEIRQNEVNKFNKLTGSIDTFLSILPGNNTMGIFGTGLNVSITIDFIPLWI